MKITVLATSEHGTLYQSAMIFHRHKYRVKQQEKEHVDSGQILYTFVLSNDGSFDGLIEDLLTVPSVVKVESLEQNSESNQTATDEMKLVQIAQNLINLYPDFVEAIQEIDSNSELGDQSILKLGQYVGEGLITQGKIKQPSPKNISLAIKKIILPAIEPFAIASESNNQVELYANPFCNNQEISDVPRCYFLTGMMQGLLNSVQKFADVTVKETSCKASGSQSCIFTIAEA